MRISDEELETALIVNFDVLMDNNVQNLDMSQETRNALEKVYDKVKPVYEELNERRQEERKTCVWEALDEYCYETSCNNTFILGENETPSDHGMVFCPYCGHQLEELNDF